MQKFFASPSLNIDSQSELVGYIPSIVNYSSIKSLPVWAIQENHVLSPKQFPQLELVKHSKSNGLCSMKTDLLTCTNSKESELPVHPLSLIKVFSDGVKNLQGPGYPYGGKPKLWSGCQDTQAPRVYLKGRFVTTCPR